MDNGKNIKQIQKETARRNRRQTLRIFFGRGIIVKVCSAILILFILVSLLSTFISPYDPNAQDLLNTNSTPTWEHILGTDYLGRDVLSRLMYGGRVSFSVSLLSGTFAAVVGILLGLIAGYVGGRMDLFMMRLVDILYAIPSTMYVILIMVVLGANMYSVLVGICISSWVGMARLVRNQVLTLKQQEFAMAAKRFFSACRETHIETPSRPHRYPIGTHRDPIRIIGTP